MAKLFAPILESKLSVEIFVEDGKEKIKFYYKKSWGVNFAQSKGKITCKIKNITTGKECVFTNNDEGDQFYEDNGEFIFNT